MPPHQQPANPAAARTPGSVAVRRVGRPPSAARHSLHDPGTSPPQTLGQFSGAASAGAVLGGLVASPVLDSVEDSTTNAGVTSDSVTNPGAVAAFCAVGSGASSLDSSLLVNPTNIASTSVNLMSGTGLGLVVQPQSTLSVHNNHNHNHNHSSNNNIDPSATLLINRPYIDHNLDNNNINNINNNITTNNTSGTTLSNSGIHLKSISVRKPSVRQNVSSHSLSPVAMASSLSHSRNNSTSSPLIGSISASSGSHSSLSSQSRSQQHQHHHQHQHQQQQYQQQHQQHQQLYINPSALLMSDNPSPGSPPLMMTQSTSMAKSTSRQSNATGAAAPRSPLAGPPITGDQLLARNTAVVSRGRALSSPIAQPPLSPIGPVSLGSRLVSQQQHQQHQQQPISSLANIAAVAAAAAAAAASSSSASHGTPPIVLSSSSGGSMLDQINLSTLQRDISQQGFGGSSLDSSIGLSALHLQSLPSMQFGYRVPGLEGEDMLSEDDSMSLVSADMSMSPSSPRTSLFNAVGRPFGNIQLGPNSPSMATIDPSAIMASGSSAANSIINRHRSSTASGNSHQRTRSTIAAAGGSPAPKRNHVCNYCSKAFSRPSALTSHVHTHTGERPFKCELEGCESRFALRSNMRRHVKTHIRRLQKAGLEIRYEPDVIPDPSDLEDIAAGADQMASPALEDGDAFQESDHIAALAAVAASAAALGSDESLDDYSTQGMMSASNSAANATVAAELLSSSLGSGNNSISSGGMAAFSLPSSLAGASGNTMPSFNAFYQSMLPGHGGTNLHSLQPQIQHQRHLTIGGMAQPAFSAQPSSASRSLATSAPNQAPLSTLGFNTTMDDARGVSALPQHTASSYLSLLPGFHVATQDGVAEATNHQAMMTDAAVSAAASAAIASLMPQLAETSSRDIGAVTTATLASGANVNALPLFNATNVNPGALHQILQSPQYQLATGFPSVKYPGQPSSTMAAINTSSATATAAVAPATSTAAAFFAPNSTAAGIQQTFVPVNSNLIPRGSLGSSALVQQQSIELVNLYVNALNNSSSCGGGNAGELVADEGMQTVYQSTEDADLLSTISDE